MLHPVAIFERKDERLRVAVHRLTRYLRVFGVKVHSARGDVHAEFEDVVKRLLALQAVEVASREFAVVVQLDRAECLVMRKYS
jgi:hypothetical protein